MKWTVRVGSLGHNDFIVHKNIQADSPLEALKQVVPNFKWSICDRHFTEPVYCYSGKDGWVEVEENV